MRNASLKIAYFILDGFPTFRPDVTALWGQYLPGEGILSDLSTTALDGSEKASWGGGKALTAPRHKNKIAEQVGSFMHDLRVLLSLRRGQYDGIQVRDKSFICIPAIIVARMLKVPFFYWMSFPIAESLSALAKRISPTENLPRWLFLKARGDVGGYLLQRIILPLSDHIFVQSDKMAEDLTALGLRRDRMTPVPMCIDPSRFSRRPHTAVQKADYVIGYLGECSRVRKIDFLFEALHHVLGKMPNVQLLIVGDAYEPADREWLRERASELGVSHKVKITGWLPSEQVMSRFGEVDVALALMAPDPLLDSTTPTKLVEYLAMGLPVVANAHPDQSRVLDESQAGLVAPFEPAAYGEAILTLLADRDLRETMASRGPNFVKNRRSYPVMAKALARIYFSLIPEKKSNA